MCHRGVSATPGCLARDIRACLYLAAMEVQFTGEQTVLNFSFMCRLCLQGLTVDLKPVRLAVSLLTSLSSYLEQPIYSEEFEEPFLVATRNYYEKEAEKYITSCPATEFLKQVRSTMHGIFTS